MTKSSQHGGRRPGAGRKFTGITVRKVTISVPIELLAEIDRQAYGVGGSSRSEVIADLCREALKRKGRLPKKSK